MDKYLYDLEGIPEDYRNIFESLNQTIKAAFAHPSQLKRNVPGIYYVVLNNELIQIDHQDESGEWIAKEYRWARHTQRIKKGTRNIK